jgi:hypothetical protein
MAPAADLEIGLYRWDDAGHYAVDLRYDAPGQPVSVRPRQSNPVTFDFDGLRARAGDPKEYGARLWNDLFADAQVRDGFVQALAHAQAARDPGGQPSPLSLRVRLYISPNAPELHGLRWETLCDPTGAWLATSERTLFSRFLISADWRPVRPAPQAVADLKALLVIADPEDLGAFQPGGRVLAKVDVEGERRRARDVLQGVAIEEWSRLAAPNGAAPRRATLDRLVAGVRQGCDVLYLVCHGALPRGEPVLYLEDEQGRVDWVTAAELVKRLEELKELPRLVVLCSCQGAGVGSGEPSSADGGALAALGPQLAEAGVPAVVAMQGNVSMATAQAFLRAFFRELLRDGQIDRAAAVGRGEIRGRADWWAPVLFLRLKTADLWGGLGTAGGDGQEFPKWDALVSSLRHGYCTALLGSGVLEGLVGSSREIAARLAETYRFPLAPQDRDDLPQVAQFLEVAQDRKFPRFELESYLRRLLRRRFAADLQDAPRSASLDDLVVRAGQALQRANPQEPHAVLARLPFPVYVTINGDTLLTHTLEKAHTADGRPKRPQVRAFRLPGQTAPLSEAPGEEAPLVYHLFGHFRNLDSLVLTEDDYFKYLLDVSAKRQQILPEVLGALTNSSLLFLGFRLEEWDFRVLLQSIKALEGSDLLGQHAHVAVQLDPGGGRFLDPESARRLLARQTRFPGDSLSIFWGNLEEFLGQLERRYLAARDDD